MTDTLGWREWLSLPELKIPAIKAKVDTGAKTSALHAFRIEPFQEHGQEYIRFWIHPLQKRKDIEICCRTAVSDQRVVKDSGGHKELRYVIKTPIRIGERQWPVEITLTEREDMLFRMLLGRSALVTAEYKVDPARSYLVGKKPARAYNDLDRLQHGDK